MIGPHGTHAPQWQLRRGVESHRTCRKINYIAGNCSTSGAVWACSAGKVTDAANIRCASGC